MKREEKQVIIDNLTEQIKAHKHIYISDISELDAAATQELRRACFKARNQTGAGKEHFVARGFGRFGTLTTITRRFIVRLTGASAVMLC